MKIHEAQRLAAHLLAQWGLTHVTVSIRPRMFRTLGMAGFRDGQPSELRLSRNLILHAPVDEVRNTILHEIAHFLAGWSAGHGPAWREACRRVGARPEVCGRMPEYTDFPWVVLCRRCKMPHAGFFTRPRRNLKHYRCTVCGDQGRGQLELLSAEELRRVLPLGQQLLRQLLNARPSAAEHQEANSSIAQSAAPESVPRVRQLSLFPEIS